MRAHALRFLAFAAVVLGFVVIGAGLAPSPARAQALDISNWQLMQFNSSVTYTFPAGTTVQPGGYVIVCRFATRAAFEAYYSVTLGANVLYFTNPSDNPAVPTINGAEVYELHDASAALIDGPTPALTNTTQSWYRSDPETPAWTGTSPTPTPAAGVEAPDAVYSGLVITEANNSPSYTYEFIELHYDAPFQQTNQPPVIADVSHNPPNPEVGGGLVINAQVTDPDGTVASVRCFWRIGTATYSPMELTGAGDTYTLTLWSLSSRGNFDYFIEAFDDDGASSRSPVGAPADFHTVWISGTPPPGKVALFDHAHGQDAGVDGNWRIDDNYPSPSPAAPTREDQWSGQLSAWAYELYLAGHTLRQNTTTIDAAMLADVDLLVIVEPQNTFAQAEITAVAEFVHAGGSLFVVANHNGSDRDGDGWDSASIFGGYSVPHINEPVGSDVETFCGAKFGLHFHVKDEGNNSITGTFSNVDTDWANPIIHGAYGAVGAVIYHVGNVMSLWPAANPELSNVAGHIWKDGDTGNPDVNIAAWSRYGLGKVMGFGDSSSCADGTDSEPHGANWTETGGNNREFFLNATAWLLRNENVGVEDESAVPALGLGLTAAPNPFNPVTRVSFTLGAAGDVQVLVFDARGRHVRTLLSGHREAGRHIVTWDGRNEAGQPMASGAYLVRAVAGGSVEYRKIALAK